MNGSMNQVLSSMMNSGGFEKNGTPKEEQERKKKLGRIEQEINKYLDLVVAELTQRTPKKIYEIYNANFNEKEIAELLKFYESTTSQQNDRKCPILPQRQLS